MSLPDTFRRRASFRRLPTLGTCRFSSPARLRLAASTGLVTLLIGWLAVALFLAPYWSAQTNFPGHQHPKGTPPHTHTVQAVIGYAALAAVVVAVQFRRSVWPVQRPPVLWLERTTPKRAHGSRAPPLF